MVSSTGDLLITKTVEGNAGEKEDKKWNFKIELGDKKINGWYGDLYFTNGVSYFNLTHQEKAAVRDLPAGVTYTVTEVEANENGYTTTVKEIVHGREITGDGAGVVESDATGNLAFLNRRDTFGTGDLEISKTVEGDSGDQKAEFPFTVTLRDSSINGKYGDMEFKNGVAHFTLKHGETKTATGLPGGLLYTVTEPGEEYGYTVRATNAKGKIIDKETVRAAFTNSRSGFGNLEIHKSIYADTIDSKQEFHFTVTLSDPTINGKYGDMEFKNGVAQFEMTVWDVKKAEKLPAGVTYTVTEEENPDRYLAVENNLTGKIKKGETVSETITNYRHYVYKDWWCPDEGDTGPQVGDTIRYSITYGNGSQETQTVVITDPLDPGVDFVSATDGGVYDPATHTVIWTLNDVVPYPSLSIKPPQVYLYVRINEKALEDAERTVENQATIQFGHDPKITTDTVTTEVGCGNLSVKKTVTGNAGELNRYWNFTVVLSDTSLSGWYGNMSFRNGIATFTLRSGDTKTAKGLPPGIRYTVTETEANADGYTTVKENDTGEILEDRTAVATFINRRSFAQASLAAHKDLKGMETGDTGTYRFDFTLTPVAGSGTDAPENPVKSAQSQSVTVNQGNGWTQTTGNFFEGVSFRENGKYYYTLEETGGSYDDVENDGTKYDVQIDVTENPAGERQAQVFYRIAGSGDDWTQANADAGTGLYSLTFTNRRKATASLKVKKTFEVGPHGSHLGPKTFTFHLMPDEGNTVIPAKDTVTVTVDSDHAEGDGSKWVNISTEDFFDGVVFEAGAYSYTLQEESVTLYPGVHYDHSVYKVVVTVSEAGDGSLQSVVTIDGTGSSDSAVVNFTNSYEPTKASVNLKGKKTLKGGTFTDGEFTFVLSADKNTPWPDDVTPIMETDGWTCEAKNIGNTFSFGNITYEKTGTYIYQICEKLGTRTDIKYDDTTYTVTVVVEEGTIAGDDTSEGVESMTRTISYKKNGEPVSITDGYVPFTNEKKFGDLTVTKTVEGSAGETDREWHFTVTLSDKTISGIYGDMEFTDGVAQVTLKHGESKTARDLPAGVAYTVTEKEANQDGYETSQEGETGSILAGAEMQADFVNHRQKKESSSSEETKEEQDVPPEETPSDPPVEHSSVQEIKETMPIDEEGMHADVHAEVLAEVHAEVLAEVKTEDAQGVLSSVKTGDDAPLVPYVCSAIAAMLLLGVQMICRRRKKRGE